MPVIFKWYRKKRIPAVTTTKVQVVTRALSEVKMAPILTYKMLSNKRDRSIKKWLSIRLCNLLKKVQHYLMKIPLLTKKTL